MQACEVPKTHGQTWWWKLDFSRHFVAVIFRQVLAASEKKRRKQARGKDHDCDLCFKPACLS